MSVIRVWMTPSRGNTDEPGEDGWTSHILVRGCNSGTNRSHFRPCPPEIDPSNEKDRRERLRQATAADEVEEGKRLRQFFEKEIGKLDVKKAALAEQLGYGTQAGLSRDLNALEDLKLRLITLYRFARAVDLPIVTNARGVSYRICLRCKDPGKIGHPSDWPTTGDQFNVWNALLSLDRLLSKPADKMNEQRAIRRHPWFQPTLLIDVKRHPEGIRDLQLAPIWTEHLSWAGDLDSQFETYPISELKDEEWFKRRVLIGLYSWFQRRFRALDFDDQAVAEIYERIFLGLMKE